MCAAAVRSSSRAFSMAMTAWAAKVVTSSICLSVKGRTSWRYTVERTDQFVLLQHRDAKKRTLSPKLAQLTATCMSGSAKSVDRHARFASQLQFLRPRIRSGRFRIRSVTDSPAHLGISQAVYSCVATSRKASPSNDRCSPNSLRRCVPRIRQYGCQRPAADRQASD